MKYKEIKTKNILNKIVNKDNLFKGYYTLDPYQNCEFGCKYCDSSYEKLIYIKKNSEDLLKNQIRKIEKKTIIIGSVHDPYQKIEKKYKITREILKIIKENDYPCHILTKSDLVLRDLDILTKMNKCKVTISISSLDKNIYKVFEKNVPSPQKRLNIVNTLFENNIKAGIALIPAMPLLIDKELENIIKKARDNNSAYFLYKYLELKGDQKKYYFDILKFFFPNLLRKYEKLYQDSYMPNQEYINDLTNKISNLSEKYNLKNRI